MAQTFRSIFRWLTPAWLHGTGNTAEIAPPDEEINEGELVLYSVSVMIDAWLESLRQGLNARFPTRAVASANRLTGVDRGIIRGRSETDEHYAARLVAWRYPRGHRVRGSAFAALEQISEYWGGVLCATIDAKRNYHKRLADGTESYSYAAQAFNWDGTQAPTLGPNWARFWAAINLTGVASATPDFGFASLWGGTIGTPGYCVGMVGVTPDDMRTMKKLFRAPRPWKPAGTRAEWLMISIDGTSLETMLAAPDGTWRNWSKNSAGVQVAARSSAYRYVSLTPEKNQTYAGDPTNWPASFTEAGGGTYAGVAGWPTPITKPDGSTYDGSALNGFPSVLLFDDGDFAK
jgi:hypothetical protein